MLQGGARACPKVWCWAELWAAIRGASVDGPRVLSEAASRAVFLEAIRRGRGAGRLRAIERVLEWPGFRRRLRARIARWTLGKQPEHRLIAEQDPIETAQKAVFDDYRWLLESIDAVDQEGLEDWASRRLSGEVIDFLKGVEHLVVLNWESAPGSARRFLAGAMGYPGSIQVTMAIDPGPGSESLFARESRDRRRFAKRGFEEVIREPAAERPRGLVELESALFREDRGGGSVGVSEGLVIRGSAQGEAMARAVASEARAALARGVDPESVLVLSRYWNEQADLAAEMLADWGLPVHAAVRRLLHEDPAVAALRLAIELPIAGWEAEQLVRLLRHGRVRPDWVGPGSVTLAEAAWAIDRTGVFRGRAEILSGLERLKADASGSDQHSKHREDRTDRALETARRFLEPLEKLDQSRSWRDHIIELERLASRLGLDQGDARGVEVLSDALADHVDAIEALGRGGEAISWAEFCREVESLSAETLLPEAQPRPGSIRMTTLDDARGARGQVVILFDLDEGTFPTREASASFARLRPGRDRSKKGGRRIAGEMVQFLSVIGRGESRVVLIHPTTDLKGRESLKAGFLDDLSRVLASEALARCQAPPLEPDEQRGSPRDTRVRAVSQARHVGDLEALAQLAAAPAHRPALLGTAVGLHSQSRRRRGAEFGEFEGRLRDGHAVLDLADRLGAGHVFSPSQIETYITCPFRFFCRYVLKLETPLERDEFEDDFALQGRIIHSLLEQYEQRPKDKPPLDESARRFLIELTLRREGARFSSPGAEEIERRKLFEAFDRYRDQADAYEAAGGSRFLESEVAFGREGSPFPSLEIGTPARPIKIQGMIDRIDQVDNGPGYRVIDYKNGKAPSGADVKSGRKMQVLLYAWAVEQGGLVKSAKEPVDMGYWALKDRGYQRLRASDWSELKKRLGEYIAELVESMRSGFFAPVPTTRDCERSCDFRGVCRVGEVRRLDKRYTPIEPPVLPVEIVRSAAKKSGGGKSKGARGSPSKVDVSIEEESS